MRLMLATYFIKTFFQSKNISCFYLHYLIKKWGYEFGELIQDLSFPPNVKTQENSETSNLPLPNSETFKNLKLQSKKIIKKRDLKKYP